jgi:hypothetical protein
MFCRKLGKLAASEAAEKGRQKLQRNLVQSLIDGNRPDAVLQQQLHLQRFGVIVVNSHHQHHYHCRRCTSSSPSSSSSSSSSSSPTSSSSSSFSSSPTTSFSSSSSPLSYERALAMRAAQEAKKFSRITREEKTPPKVKFGSVFTAADSNLL